MELSRRLTAIARMVPAGSVPADIGTDHAYLPIALVAADHCPRAIAGDVHRGPYQLAMERVIKAGLQDRISVRLGDGLTILRPGEADGIIIAGMGGQTMIQILTAGAMVREACSYLILQPMTDIPLVREQLAAWGWFVLDEELLQEEGKFYQIIKYGRQEKHWPQPFSSQITRVFGPALLARKHPLLLPYLEKLKNETRKVLTALGQTHSPKVLARSREMEKFLEQLGEVEAWLKSGKSSAG